MYALSRISYYIRRLSGIILIIFLTLCGANHLMKGHKGSYSIFGQIEGKDPGMTVPAFKIRYMNNKVYSNKKLRGEFLFINFWATWCKPCIEELPLLEEAFVRSKRKNRCKKYRWSQLA